MQEIIKELTAKRNKSERDSEQVLMWVQIVEAQRAQKKAIGKMRAWETLIIWIVATDLREIMSSSPKNSTQRLRYTTVSTVAQHMARGNAKHLGKHAVQGGKGNHFRAVCHSSRGWEWVWLTPSSPNASMRCIKRSKSLAKLRKEQQEFWLSEYKILDISVWSQ